MGEISEGVDLAPREARGPQVPRLHGQELVGRGQASFEQCRDACDGPSGRSDGQLLSGDLEEERPEQVHRRKLVQPRLRIEVRPLLDEPPDHRVSFAKLVLGTPKARLTPVGARSRGLTSWHGASQILFRTRYRYFIASVSKKTTEVGRSSTCPGHFLGGRFLVTIVPVGSDADESGRGVEDRVDSAVARDAGDPVFHAIDLDAMRGLEIGPLYRPRVSPTHDVRYVDHYSTEELRAGYAVNAVAAPFLDDIVEVDYVLRDGATIASATKEDAPFDYVVASHVIEHVVDPIGWLRDIERSLLRKG